MLIVCDKINTISFINGIKCQLFLIFLGILVKFSHCSLQAFGLMRRIKLRVAIGEKRLLFATIRRISYICSQLIK